MESDLNPEAPEFTPHMGTAVQDGYNTMKESVKSTNSFPSGSGYNVYNTVTSFCQITNNVEANINDWSNKILAKQCTRKFVKINQHDVEGITEIIVLANDSIINSLNIKIDTASGANDVMQGQSELTKKISSWNEGPILQSGSQDASSFMMSAKNIPKPQLKFKDVIDNSQKTMFVPKILDKPNNIKPFALIISYDKDGDVLGYEHPYKLELNMYTPPARFLAPEPPQLPLEVKQTQLKYIDKEVDLDELVYHLNSVHEIAVDTEHHGYRSYQGITCLIQISTDVGGDFIIDALAIREHIHKLNQPFTNPNILKVFHGAELDVLWLQRDFGVYIVGMFDTYQAAKMLDFPGRSLKYLLLNYCKIDVDKKYQLADWRLRPLPDPLIEYARMDTHYLLYIAHCMMLELIEKDGGQTALLLSVFDQSRRVCGQTYTKAAINDESHMPLYRRSKKRFNSRQMAALKMLFKWRDSMARELDESVGYLLPNHMLLILSEALPREVQGVNACCTPMTAFIKDNLIEIHRMILACRELPLEPQLYKIPDSLNTMASTELNYNAHDLAQRSEHSGEDKFNGDIEPSDIGFDMTSQPDVGIFQTDSIPMQICGSNMDRKFFVQPFERYQNYRKLAQMEEIKEFKEKEARITAISKDNALIKSEVLAKVQQLRSNIPDTSANQPPVIDLVESSDDEVVCVDDTKQELLESLSDDGPVCVDGIKKQGRNEKVFTRSIHEPSSSGLRAVRKRSIYKPKFNLSKQKVSKFPYTSQERK